MPGIENQKPSGEEISQVREQASKLFEKNGLHNYSQEDISRLQQDEVVDQFWLHTYWFSGEQIDETVNMIEKTFKWRKDFGVNQISKESLKNELLEGGSMSVREEMDKCGNNILVKSVRKHFKNAETAEEMKKVIIFLLEEIRKNNFSQRTTLVFDCAGAGLKNVDMDIIKFLIHIFENYYPNMLEKILVYDLPWILNPVLTIIKALLPPPAAKMLHMVTRRDVGDHLTATSWLGDQ